VLAQCGLPYASVAFEIDGNGEPIYGIEIDVPYVGLYRPFFHCVDLDMSGLLYYIFLAENV